METTTPAIHQRKNIRWKNFDYSSPRYYYVTVNVHDRLHLLGEVDGGEMRTNAAGQMVYETLQQIPIQYEGTEITSVMIMPNHVHFMLFNGGGFYLPDIMRWFKSITTNRYIHGVKEQGWQPFSKTFWQRNYYDRVIRDQREFENTVRYIQENPQRWTRRGVPPCTPDDTQGRTRGYAPTVLMLLVLLLVGCANAQTSPTMGVHGGTPLRTGAEMLFLMEDAVFPGPNIAVVGNHTSIVGSTHLVDTLLSAEVNVVKIFCPEHGFRGTAAAGAHIDNSTDPETGLPIISLYGKNKKPTLEQMKDIDVVLFDLQDVGCRFYTYISTLHYVMEACAEANIPLIVLDRPNPNGHYVDGPVLDTAHYRSFVGMHPVPVVYGMTIGEYALMINGEHWLKGGIECRLTVVPMQGYRRDSVGYELPVPPSPNLRNAHAIALYPSLCLFEGTNCGVGRGTGWPFEWVTHGTDTLDLRQEDAPAAFSLKYLMEMHRRVPKGKFFLKNNFFDKLAGNGDLRKQIQQGMGEEEIRATWQPGLERFREIREKYLIYK